ncbi:MAG TPA: tRNA epoxyqueuosine(34) reductase QueG [Anaerolineaceae bacterium]|nr:tRNA epoxyqueuosine(34) reductase QueG [Anaerolineaceae bacterium]
MNGLRQVLQDCAEARGLHLLGISPAQMPTHIEVYEKWIEAGKQAEMGYLARPDAVVKRRNPAELLPGLRSIAVVGLRYAAPGPAVLPGDPTRGQVAAYAWGKDYHSVIPEKLQWLAEDFQKASRKTFNWRIYTDTGPLLERDLAQQAGLGWIGKNTCLISPAWGSFILLGELLFDTEIEADAPFTADRCGTCTRCIEACPTGCIGADRTLDARRCISYLTIEHKGSIPPELRPALGNRVFGCDICQQVCPWNRKWLNTAGDAALEPRAETATPALIEALGLSAAEFNIRFKDSPILRAKRRGYLRNVATALGNAGLTDAIPALENALLNEPEPLIRGAAAWALGQIGSATRQQILWTAQKMEGEPEVQMEIRAALQKM